MVKIEAFIFLGDRIKTSNGKSLKLHNSYLLRRPNRYELNKIKSFIDDYKKILPLERNPYELEPVSDTVWDILEEENWNYWIIDSKSEVIDNNIELLMSLSSLDLTVLFYGFRFYGLKEKNVVSIVNNQLQHTAINFFLDFSNAEKSKTITLSEVKEFKYLHALILSFEDVKTDFEFIKKATTDFLKIKEFATNSPFKILGYFSILELLLTTYRPKNINDSSLNIQLQKKIKLLNNLLGERIDIKHFFKGPDTLTIEIIIEKLYRYRNDIAHGNTSDFENELHILKNNRDKIFEFLHLLLKKVLIKSLETPQLIKDLKEC